MPNQQHEILILERDIENEVKRLNEPDEVKILHNTIIIRIYFQCIQFLAYDE